MAGKAETDKSTNQGGQTNIQYQRAAAQNEDSVKNDMSAKEERAELVQQERT